MGNLYTILQNPSDTELKEYIQDKTKRLDIDNCVSIINTFIPNIKFNINRLKQYCEDNSIPYFTKGEYDIFTLEEIEYIIYLLNTSTKDTTIEAVYDCFKGKYPKRNTDLTLIEFKNKLIKLDLIKEGEELNTYMRYTNDVIEFVQDTGKEHTIEESLNIIQNKYPSLNMNLQKLNEMKEKYLISFIEENLQFFSKNEVELIKRLVQSTNSIKEMYNIFEGSFPYKCANYIEFIKELNNLKLMTTINKKEFVGDFTLLENALLEYLLEKEQDNASLYSIFNKTFPNKYAYMQFVTKLNELKVARLPKSKIVHKGRDENPETVKLKEYLESFNGEKTLNELLELVNNNDEFKDYTRSALYQFCNKKDIPFVKEKKKSGAIKDLTEKDWNVIKKLAEDGYTRQQIKDEADKRIPALKKIAFKTFSNVLSKHGISTRGTNKGKKRDAKTGGRKSCFATIYDDAVVTIEGNTLPKALEELKRKHPDLADNMTYSGISYFAKRNNLNFKKESREEMLDRMKKTRELKKSNKTRKVRGIADEVYSLLKEISKDYTIGECSDIINKRFNVNYTDTYINTLVSRRGKLEFKVCTEFTDDMKETLNTLVNNMSNKHDIYSEFSKSYPRTFKPQKFFQLLKELKPDNIPEDNYAFSHHNITETEKQIEPTIEPVIEQYNPVDMQSIIEQLNRDIGSNDANKYQPIIDEVNNTFEKKCKQLGISGDTYSHLNEIIYALEILTKYAKNKNKLVRLTNDHEDVLEQYRREVEHEVEVQPFQDTDTYCQNKLKAIGMRRREVKYTRDDLNIMSMLLKNVNDNIEVYDKTLEALKHRQQLRENSVFIPLVDTDMVKRLDWCKQATLYNKKAYTPILKTNARIDRVNKSKAEGRDFWTEREPITAPDVKQGISKEAHRISTYRVKAEFLVLNGNPFVNKYYDVKSTNEDLAKDKAIEYFDLISANNDGAQYNIVDVTRLNR